MNGSQNISSGARRQEETLRKMVYAAIFAAITYVAFAYLSIPVSTPGGGKVTIHLGNAFCVLGALILGSAYGGVGGALGLTIADLMDPVYIVEAPVTFLVKLLLGVVAGLVAHRAGHINTQKDPRKVLGWVIAACVCALAFNAVADPVLRYFYKILIIGKPAAEVSFVINFGVTLFNSAISAVIAAVLYMAVRVPLRRLGLNVMR